MTPGGPRTVSVILGPPGAGKTSVARHLAAGARLWHLSSGDLLRKLSGGTGDAAARLRQQLADGIPPDDIACEEVLAALAGPGGHRAVLLDGFPRTLAQADALDGQLGVAGTGVRVLLYLTVSEQTALYRLGQRRVCPVCGPVATVGSTAPDERCGTCGRPVERRWGDTDPDVLHERRAVFYRDSGAVLDHYAARGRLVALDAEEPPDVVLDAARTALTAATGVAAGPGPATAAAATVAAGGRDGG